MQGIAVPGGLCGPSFDILFCTLPSYLGDWRSGSAAALQAEGHRFESCIAHHLVVACQKGYRYNTQVHFSHAIRAVSSAGEHYLHTVGVAGSNPGPPTTCTARPETF